ncbi:response regulator transcription factor [Streptomyces sp. AV19]|nr:response regulator transcription factor [Streptomyces sp. AV19]
MRVLIAEDEPLIRYALRTMIESAEDITVVGEADDGAEAVSLAGEEQPDVVLMDVCMRPVGGVDATRQMRRVCPEARVLIVTSHYDGTLVGEALEAGAGGFVLKTASPEQLLRAVRTVATGDMVFSSPVGTAFLNRCQVTTHAHTPVTADEQARLATLSRRELDVLGLLAEGLSNADIARVMSMAPATIKTYVSRILRKLRLENRTQAAILAYEADLSKNLTC